MKISCILCINNILHELIFQGMSGDIGSYYKNAGSESCVYSNEGAQKHSKAEFHFKQSFDLNSEEGLQCCWVFQSSGHESLFLLHAICSLKRKKIKRKKEEKNRKAYLPLKPRISPQKTVRSYLFFFPVSPFFIFFFKVNSSINIYYLEFSPPCSVTWTR